MSRPQQRAIAIQRYIFYLVVVNNIGFRSRIREGIHMLLTRRAMTRYDTFHIDDFKHTRFAFTPQNVETSIVQLGLCHPSNVN